MSRRVPILSPFTEYSPHLEGHAMPIDFSVIFDLPRLRDTLQWSILEWSDLKLSTSRTNATTMRDELKCWALEDGDSRNEADGDGIRDFFNFGGLQIPSDETILILFLVSYFSDITYTTAPDFAFMPNDWWGSFTGLASLLRPEGYAYAMSHSEELRSFAPITDSQVVNSTIWPDQHMACFRHLYYLAGRVNYEHEKDINPMWNLVGVNIHFTSTMDELANGYIRRIFGVNTNARIPPVNFSAPLPLTYRAPTAELTLVFYGSLSRYMSAERTLNLGEHFIVVPNRPC